MRTLHRIDVHRRGMRVCIKYAYRPACACDLFEGASEGEITFEAASLRIDGAWVSASLSWALWAECWLTTHKAAASHQADQELTEA